MNGLYGRCKVGFMDERADLFVVRVWFEGPGHDRFRARIIVSGLNSEAPPVSFVTASQQEVVEKLREWLAEVALY